MAKFSGFFLCFVAFLKICDISAHSDYYFYETVPPHHKSQGSVSIILENDKVHTYSKRDVSTIESASQLPNITEEVTIRQKTSTTRIPVKPPLSNRTFESVPILTDEDIKKHLLGWNGTGQRKEVLKSTQPPLIHNASVLSLDPSVSRELESELSEIDIDESAINQTLSKHNITTFKTDSHQYYNSTLDTNPESGRRYWVELSNKTDVKVNELLSKSYRRAATVKLSFEFPFYGHFIKNVTIATGGFLYTGEYVHSWLAATQYIAPLMANFDTSLSPDSYVKYYDNGTAFTVQWENVSLRERPNDGKFTFQVTLYKNGDIVFVYKSVPLLIKDIKDDQHPVKVGLSDAYIADKTFFYVRRKTIYEYHRVYFPRDDIKNWTVIYLKALPTCLDNKDCNSCVTALQTFPCRWCPALNRCSSGRDRFTHQWVTEHCHMKNISDTEQCLHANSDTKYVVQNNNVFLHLDGDSKESQDFNDAVMRVRQPNEQLLGISGVMAILFLIGMVFGLTAWIFYAYRNPHTTSGQILIRYRPSQWRFRRGEARYTAATIHM